MQPVYPKLFHIDTSCPSNHPISFQRIAFTVAEKIVMILEELSTQHLLVTTPVEFEGYETDPVVVEATVRQILNNNELKRYCLNIDIRYWLRRP